MKYLIIDSRMRKIEKETLRSFGYEIIELEESQNLYYEISSHVDIFCTKINDKLVVENSHYDFFKDKLNSVNTEIICGIENVMERYPYDIKYNVCQIGKNIIHNFNYTDKKVLEIIEDEKLNKISISQGYSNCSIAVISKNSAIVNDFTIADCLIRNNINVLCLDYIPDIKLYKDETTYSKMKGFIGGAIARIDDKIIVFGDLQKIDKTGEIKKFIERQKLEIVDFKGLDVIDYGGIVEIYGKKIS